MQQFSEVNILKECQGSESFVGGILPQDKKEKSDLSKFLSVESKKILVCFISSGFITSDKLQRGRAYRIEK